VTTCGTEADGAQPLSADRARSARVGSDYRCRDAWSRRSLPNRGADCTNTAGLVRSAAVARGADLLDTPPLIHHSR
jgi:hypothetical protein